MTLSAIQTAIVAGLAARYTDLTVVAHGGQFTERELPLLLAQAPALLVASAGLDRLTPSGETAWRGQVRWAVYVLGNDLPADPPDPAVPRAALAADTALDLLLWLPDQRWSLAVASLPDPESFSADNLYTGHVNNLRVALWGVTWIQTFLFTPE